MKIRLLTCIIMAAAFLAACKKDTSANTNRGFIKSLSTDFEAITVGSVLLDDNSMIVVCRSQSELVPGFMYKVDSRGNILWKKSLNDKNRGCYQVYDLKGNGFAVLGFETVDDQYFQVFRYDDDGNFISSKAINFNKLWYSVRYFSAIQMHELSNGNFVFAYNEGDLILNITNNSFDSLYRKTVKVGKFSGAFVRGICQNTDSTILFATTVGNLDLNNINDMELDLQIVQTDLQGNLKSNTFIGDSLTNETPNVLLPMSNSNRLLLVTGRMGSFKQGKGAVVNYLNNGYTTQISGDIQLVELTNDAQFETRRGIRNYPANGMIMNGRPTSDGGFILCGTVGQADVINIISPTRIYLLKLNAAGRFEWSKAINTTFPAYGIDVQQTSDGGYFISGYEFTFDKKYNVLVIKTDRNGDL